MRTIVYKNIARKNLHSTSFHPPEYTVSQSLTCMSIFKIIISSNRGNISEQKDTVIYSRVMHVYQIQKKNQCFLPLNLVENNFA